VITLQLPENIFLGSEKIWLRVPDDGLIPGQTGRLTVGRKITLTLFLRPEKD
jgi:hypothetical protein